MGPWVRVAFAAAGGSVRREPLVVSCVLVTELPYATHRLVEGVAGAED